MSSIKFVFAIIFTFLHNGLGSEEEDRIRAIYAKCREETQIEESEMETFKRMELPTTNRGKCMMGCLMREASINTGVCMHHTSDPLDTTLRDLIVNGKFYKEGALKVAEKYYSDKQEEMDKAKMVIDVCEKRIENETEECEIAGKLATCVIEEAQKQGLPFMS